MKKIIKKLTRLANYLEDCHGVSHKADDLLDIIDELQIICGMPRERVLSGRLTALDANWCVLIRVCPADMVEVFNYTEVGEEVLPRFHAGEYEREGIPMRAVEQIVIKQMNAR